MQVYAGLDPRMPLSDLGAYAARLEDLGYDGLNVAEMLHDPFVASTLALSATSALRVRTAVALAFVRSPMATALSAWGLAQMSGGRFDLGLGTQIRANIEERYGAAFERPVARMADYVAAVRACFDAFESARPLRHEGDFYRLTRLQPDFRPEPLGETRPPEVWLGAVGEQMVRLTGRVGDGLVTHPTNSHPVDLTERIVPELGGAAEQAGRPRPPIVAGPLVATGLDRAAVTEALTGIRRRLAFLYSTPAYEPTLHLLGFPGLGGQLRELTRVGAWERLDEIVDDELLNQVVPSGTWEELPSVLADWYGGLVDGLTIRPPGDDTHDGTFRDVIAELRRIASH